MELKLKPISQGGIPEALEKIALYRYLNEPEEAESICRDILAVDADNQAAIRLLALTITDQFTGALSDRYAEAEGLFGALADPYEQLYYGGLLYERRAKAQLEAGRPAASVVPLFEEAMRRFDQAEKIRPAGNDDALLRWNRCVRLLESLPGAELEEEAFDAHDSPPI
jgi:tetratricopeptide (TPR) repeat protein